MAGSKSISTVRSRLEEIANELEQLEGAATLLVRGISGGGYPAEEATAYLLANRLKALHPELDNLAHGLANG